MSAAVSLRPAREADAARLSQIAVAAKTALGYSADLIEGWRRELTVDAALLRRQVVWVAESVGEARGFFSLHASGGDAVLDHLWVAPDAQRRGIGGLLMRKAMRIAVESGALVVRIDAEPLAEDFYLRHGFHRDSVLPAPIPGDAERVRPQMARGL